MSTGSTTVYASPSGLVRVTAEAASPRAARRWSWRRKAVPDAPERPSEHAAFVVAHWTELAAAAAEGYARHGAGAVVLWRERAEPRASHRPFAPERLWYATQLLTLPGAGPDAIEGWAASLIETYDPRTEAVVVFAEGAALTGYRVGGTPAPPEALRLSRAATN